MTGIEEGLAAIITSLTAAAPEVGAAAATTAGSVGTAAATAATAGSAAAAGGLTLAEAALAASALSSAGGSAAQLLADKPKIPTPPPTPTRDDAQREADLRSELYRKRGRAAALLTPGGAKGDTSSASLGAASLLGG